MNIQQGYPKESTREVRIHPQVGEVLNFSETCQEQGNRQKPYKSYTPTKTALYVGVTYVGTMLVSQARPTSAREGKGLVNCIYKLCPGALYSAVQSHCSILSHDAVHHCLSSNSSLENGERELGHLF